MCSKLEKEMEWPSERSTTAQTRDHRPGQLASRAMAKHRVGRTKK